jgi:hypothetical protein
MADLEMISIGSNLDGDPVYQVGSRNSDGKIMLASNTIMTEAEARAMIASKASGEVIEAVAEPVVEEAEVIEEAEEINDTVVDVDSMSKLQLEAYMREHGIELDRRKKKKDLLSQVKAFFKE